MRIGLMPYHEIMETPVIVKNVISGVLPTLNPLLRERSFIESRLVAIMERMLQPDFKVRPTMLEVVEYLQETRRLARERASRRHRHLQYYSTQDRW